MIDPHVHLRDWNESYKETILHGLETAWECGIDVLFDMPNTSPALTGRESVLRRIEDGRKATEELYRRGKKVVYHIYLGLTSDENQIKEMVDLYNELFPSVIGLKLFASHSTGNMGIIGEEDQKKVWSTLSSLDYRGVVAVHSEKTSYFTSAPSHYASRPRESEIESVRDQIRFATDSSFKGTLHIAHISTSGALSLVKDAKEKGEIRITTGATAHHALLNYSSENQILRMNPPLRSEEDRLSIFNGLLTGDIDWIESDHAPHTLQDKMEGKCGIPGFEGTLLLIEELRRKGIKEERLSALLSSNISSAFGIEESKMGVPAITEEMKKKAASAYPFSPWASRKR